MDQQLKQASNMFVKEQAVCSTFLWDLWTDNMDIVL